jgi:hypothetical protein
LPKKRLDKPEDVVACLESTLPNINLELSTSKRKNPKPFDFGALMKAVNDHRDKHGTSKKEDFREDNLSRIPASRLRDVNADGTTNPPGPNWSLFKDPDNANGIVFAETEREANELRRRGIQEVTETKVFRRGASLATLPWPAPAAAAVAAAAAALPQDDGGLPPPGDTEVPLYDRPPPDEIFTPHEYIPRLREGGRGTDREKCIECFEVKVVCEEKDEVYSPIRLWDRKEYAKISTLNSRLLLYYFAKQNLSTGSAKETLENVKKVARKHAKETYGGDERYVSGNNLKYFEICLALYASSASMSTSGTSAGGSD